MEDNFTCNVYVTKNSILSIENKLTRFREKNQELPGKWLGIWLDKISRHPIYVILLIYIILALFLSNFAFLLLACNFVTVFRHLCNFSDFVLRLHQFADLAPFLCDLAFLIYFYLIFHTLRFLRHYANFVSVAHYFADFALFIFFPGFPSSFT